MSSGWNDSRPMSPFTTVWRWHVTMVMSILHRASGVALAGGSVLLSAWLLAVAMGPKAYNQMMEIVASWPGRAVLFGFTLALFFHLFNGVRHLIWDAGHGYDKETANKTAWLVLMLALFTTLGVWAVGYWVLGSFDTLGNK